MSDEAPDQEPSGHGAILGVIFAVALAIGAIYLMDRMRDAASLFDCAFTKDPKCRALIRD